MDALLDANPKGGQRDTLIEGFKLTTSFYKSPEGSWTRPFLVSDKVMSDSIDTLVEWGGLEPAAARAFFETRYWGAFWAAKHGAGRIRPGGSITFTSGGLSSRPRLGAAMLTAALAGVEALAPALALEMAPVRVNAVTPGLIDTPLLYNTYGPERDTIVKNRAAVLPGKRIGTAEEVAQVMLMFMTNEYITGAVLHIDGGSRYL